MLDAATLHVRTGAALNPDQVRDVVAALADEAVAPELKAGFLTALAVKGETPDEIAAFARELRSRTTPVHLPEALKIEIILDVCGTGGDRLNTFNISTVVAIVAASAGVKVAKHGNRAITSRSGSADVLEALRIPVDLSPEAAADSLASKGFAFFFAQRFHPAFKHIGPARKLCADKGQRTIFNFLGPLLNPVRPSAQLVGVPHPSLCEPIARVLQMLGTRRAMVVSGAVPEQSAFLDELSPLGETTIAEFYQEAGFSTSTLPPGMFPLGRATLASLAGGDRDENARIAIRILDAEEQGPKRETVLLNAGAALLVAGRARSIAEGWELAAELIDSGRARAKLEELRS